MFIYDAWDDLNYRTQLRGSRVMRRAKQESLPKIGGETVADQVLKGAYIGLIKRVLTEDDDPGDHLPGEIARELLGQAFNNAYWPELRRVCKGNRSKAAIAASSILETITQQVERSNEQARQRAGKGKSKSNKGVPTLDKAERAEEAQAQAEHDEDMLERMEEMKQQAQSKREENSIDAAMRKVQARKDMNEKVAEEAEAQAREAMERVSRRVGQVMGDTLQKAAKQIETIDQGMKELQDAGLIDEDLDDLMNEVDDTQEDDWSAWGGGDEDDEDEDDEGMSEEEIDELFGRGTLSKAEREEMAKLTTAQIMRQRAASDIVKMSEGMVKLAQELGRIKAVFTSAMKPTPIPGNPGAIEGISYGQNISQLTSGGMVMLGSKRMRRIFRMNFVEESLPERQMWGPDLSGRGPIILAVDCSSSMGYEKLFWAKALGMALLAIAKEQDRDFAWLAFNSTLAQRIVIPNGRADMTALTAIEQLRSNGGTSYAAWMQAAVEIMEGRHEFAKADVIVVSDGEPGERPTTLSDAEIDTEVERYRKAHDYQMEQGWITQAEVDRRVEEHRMNQGLWQWWTQARDRLGFRSRGVYISERRGGPIAESEGEIARIERETEARMTLANGVYWQSWAEGQRTSIAVIRAEIKAGFEITSPVTAEAIDLAVAWHNAQVTETTGDHARRDAHQQRIYALNNWRSVAHIMGSTCDAWADVSQITDPEQTERVEAEIARMVE